MEQQGVLYVSVILPIKLKGEITYIVPAIYKKEDIDIGSKVLVNIANKVYTAIVYKIYTSAPNKEIEYKPILEIVNLPKIPKESIKLWQEISNYYLCSIGEVYNAAYPKDLIKQDKIKSRFILNDYISSISPIDSLQKITLSAAQQEAYNKIEENAKQHPILLKGVTGSGKTELYINLAVETMQSGKNVLYLAPEIAITNHLEQRLKSVFKERVLVYNSNITINKKKIVHTILSKYREHKQNYIVIGTRSSIFLPFKDLGLIIVDEEHDSSYKQTEPSPRYNARDCAVILSTIHKCSILLGSATPSFESEYNAIIKKFYKVELAEKYYTSSPPKISIIDTIWYRKSKQMIGSFSNRLINELKETIEKGEQALVFKNRRSYYSFLECSECGDVPKCPHCNVYLSYHKFNNSLVCHYCNHSISYNNSCNNCHNNSMVLKGAGTERLEEELKEIIPNANIARYDADIIKNKRKEKEIITNFANGKIDILVGTQIITKGFDFNKLTLVAVIDADSITNMADFRADEKSIQLFTQLLGRSGRRELPGKILIQTNQKNHPVYNYLRDSIATTDSALSIPKVFFNERNKYNFTPFVRLVKLIVKHKNIDKLNTLTNNVSQLLKESPCNEFTGPFSPVIDKIRGEHLQCFYIKFSKDKNLIKNKQILYTKIENLKAGNSIIIDVDPM